MLANVLALIFTVVLLIFMGYFMLGSLPLLVLKHDTPLDSRFIRGFFNIYYRVVPPTAIAAATAYAFAGQLRFCIGIGFLAVVVFLARRVVIPGMDALRETMTAEDTAAVARFRRLHKKGMLLNFLLLAGFGFSLAWLKF